MRSHSKRSLINMIVCFVTEVEKQIAPSLENVPSNFYESVCMPDLNEIFEHGYPVPEQKVASMMNNSNSNSTNSSNNNNNQAYMDGECI